MCCIQTEEKCMINVCLRIWPDAVLNGILISSRYTWYQTCLECYTPSTKSMIWSLSAQTLTLKVQHAFTNVFKPSFIHLTCNVAWKLGVGGKTRLTVTDEVNQACPNEWEVLKAVYVYLILAVWMAGYALKLILVHPAAKSHRYDVYATLFCS